MMTSRNVFMALILSLSWLGNALADQGINLTLTGEKHYNLGPFIHFFNDKEEAVEHWEIWEKDNSGRIKWHHSKNNEINFGYESNPHWFKIEITNENQSNEDWVLELAAPLMDNVDIYLFNTMGKVTQYYYSGDHIPADLKAVPHPNFVFPISIPFQEKRILYVHIQSKGAIQVPINLWTWESFNERTTTYFLLQGIFIGLASFMFLFNFALLVAKREKIYIFYTGYILSICLFHLGRQGITYQFLWPAYPEINDFINLVSLLTGIGCICYFVSLFFDFKNQYPFSYKLCTNLGHAFFLSIPIALIMPYNMALNIITFMATGLSFMFAYISIYMLMEKHPYARYFAMAWFSFVVGAMLLPMAKLGWIPRSIITEYGMQFGIAIEIMFFSLALADRMVTLKANMIAAKNRSLSMAIQVSKQKEKTFELQKQYLQQSIEQNHTLEKKVHQRTQELNDALEELGEANTRLRQASITDGLTGLHNRNYFDEQWQVEYKRAHREQSCISLLLLDIDHFKSINDQFGHPAGDQCIQAVTKALTNQASRDMDLVARYGGEEFAIILPNTSLAGARKIAEMIRIEVANLEVNWEDSPINMTISIGIASQTPKESDYLSREAMLKRADQALYEAKRNGRNRVEVYESR